MFVCDFCSERAYYLYDADDVIIDLGAPLVHASQGGWAACVECSACIETDNRDELATRGYQAWRERGLPPGEALGILRVIHLAFFESRKGPRKLLLENGPPSGAAQQQPEGDPK